MHNDIIKEEEVFCMLVCFLYLCCLKTSVCHVCFTSCIYAIELFTSHLREDQFQLMETHQVGLLYVQGKSVPSLLLMNYAQELPPACSHMPWPLSDFVFNDALNCCFWWCKSEYNMPINIDANLLNVEPMTLLNWLNQIGNEALIERASLRNMNI